MNDLPKRSREGRGASDKPSARERGLMRRRLRRQQRVREALLLDLGALVYELHRQGRREPELLQAKAAELTAVDDEVRALADALGADRTVLQLVAAGVTGSCTNCGGLMTSDARFCSNCGAATNIALAGEPEPARIGSLRDGDGDAAAADHAEAATDEYHPLEEEPAAATGEAVSETGEPSSEEAEPDADTEPEAEADPGLEPEPTTEREPEPQPEPEPEPEAEPEPELEAEPEPELEAEPEPELEAEPESEVQAPGKPEPEAQADAEQPEPEEAEAAPPPWAEELADEPPPSSSQAGYQPVADRVGKALRQGMRRGRKLLDRRSRS
jgi:hypothetical protein